MKQNRKRTLLLACTVLLVFGLFIPSTMAMEGTTYTRALSADLTRAVRTQEAYIPAGTFFADLGMTSPEDLFYHDGKIYIADSGNHRVLVCSPQGALISVIGEDVLKKPTGIAVAEDGTIYVADYSAEAVVVFSSDGAERMRIERPTAVYYGSGVYRPRKVALDHYGNLYVVSEGTNEGIIQFNLSGEFGGFFGANKTPQLTLREWFQKTFYTDEQKSKLTFRSPASIVSLDTAENGLVYSATQGERFSAIKALNMAGYNILPDDFPIYSMNYVDVAVTDSGAFYGVTDEGVIDEFNESGMLLVFFGGRAATTDRNGLTAVASAIDTDPEGNLYVLDKERGTVQIWYPTDYAALLHRANNTFRAGEYEESLACWQEILRMNPATYMAHEGVAVALFQLGRYQEAAEHAKIIGERSLYSACFWELRSAWLNEHIQSIVLFLAGLLIAVIVLHQIRRKHDFLLPLKRAWAASKRKHPMLGRLIDDPLYQIRHPIDGVYYLKIEKRGSFGAAAVLYGTAFAVYLLCRAGTSFVFGGGFWLYSSPVAVSLIVLVPAALFIVGSYLISSINDGEGTLRQSFIAIGYSLSAFILFWPILAGLSWLFTYAELFQFQLLQTLVLGYTGVMLFLAVKETHAYTPKKTIANLLLTLAFMVIAVLAGIVLYILWKELIGFVAQIVEEVKYRVFS
ncbi:MAG TPA: tetratricopeptide repeat protein [Feifaniaceae bacterium]|nr:tetratricopeptide repeat protein [Feifaniaceae bacterium]